MRTIPTIHERARGRVPRRRAALLAGAAIALMLYACSSDSPSGPDPSACALSVTSLDFGAVLIGQSVERTFTITNTGSGTISGVVSMVDGGGAFTVIIGGGAFELVAAQQRTVVVRFTPSASGAASASVNVGAGCGDVALSGAGDIAAQCVVSADTLDFGAVPTGDEASLDFIITNAGGGRVTGAASEDCDDIDLLLGNSPYDLGAGDSLVVRVRFMPSELGARECFIETGSDSCPDVIVRGIGAPPPVCDLSESALAFGAVPAGESATRSLTITNTGAGILGGLLGLSGSCAEFSIDGDPAFSLAPDSSREVILRFAPASEGAERVCALAFGTFRCGEVMLTGTGGPPALCVVTPAALEFGEVIIGESATLPFTIENQGQGTLAGTVAAPCEGFAIDGNASYSLTAGESQGFTVRFAPVAAGAAVCTLAVGDPRCVVVVARGAGVPPPSCELAPAALAFGVVDVGDSADRVLTITNAGGGLLSGTVSLGSGAFAGALARGGSGGGGDGASAARSLQCEAFSIIGDAGYELGAGESDSVVVRFAPAIEGDAECAIDAGSALCDAVSATGNGFLAPLCEIEPDSLAFGTVAVGQFADRALTIRNAGGSVLAGSVTESCEGFSVQGVASYALTAGQTHIVTLRFQPADEGDAACTFDTGADSCADVPASGTGTLFSACSLSVASLDFETVTVGESADRAFTLTNTGNLPLDGTVAVGGEAGCGGFAIIGPAGYDLAPAEFASFTVRFAPAAEGNALCTIDTGDNACVDVSASGIGFLAAACSVSAASLDFDTVTVGEPDSLTFTITNIGGSTLEGTVSEACAEFSVVGDADYALTADQTQSFTIRYAPSAEGASSCTLATGASACADLALSGVGFIAPLCELSTDSLDFGTVTIGEADTLSFSITNTGGSTLAGTVSESCNQFSLLDDPNYDLAADSTQSFRVRFAPTVAGGDTCTIETGSELCDDVTAIGAAVEPVQCSVSVPSVNFGTIVIGACDTSTVTIFNVGGATLAGTARLTCASNYSFTATSDTTFSLAPDSSHSVQVRFTPTATPQVTCGLTFGAACDTVDLSGSGSAGPICNLNTTSLSFGSVDVNSADTLNLIVRNTGGGTLSGSLAFLSGSSEFSFLGNTTFSLGAGLRDTTKVRFAPTNSGFESRAIAVAGSLVGGCDGGSTDLCMNDVTCTGTGEALGCADDVEFLFAACVYCHPTFNCDFFITPIDTFYINLGMDEQSRLLLYPSQQGDGASHSGGELWPADEAAYNTVLRWIKTGANP